MYNKQFYTSQCWILSVVFETFGIHCPLLMPAKKFKMASKVAAIFTITGLSLRSLQGFNENRVKVKITCVYSLNNNRIFNDYER